MLDSDLFFLDRYYSNILAVMKNMGSLKWLLPFFILLHFLIGAFIPPLVTSDFERNLFYGKAFWKHGFRVYDMTPIKIDPSYDVRDPLTGEYSYPNTTYDYPTLQLLFWAGLSPLPFSSIIVKWFLSCIDILNFFIIYSLIMSRQNEEKQPTFFENGFAMSYLILSIPFSAIEGQPTAITILFLLLPLSLHSQRKICSYLSIGLGFQWKYISLILLPYLLILDRNTIKQALLGLLAVVISIILLSFPLLFSNFILRYFGFFGNLGEYSSQLPSNPLFIFYPSISSLLSSGVLILAFLYWIGFFPRENSIRISVDGTLERAYWLPSLILLIFLKIYTTAFPWYWLWFFPCLTILPQTDRRLFTFLLVCTFTIGIIDFIQMTVGLSTFIGFFF
ncbi:MAG: hypothetical protein ACFFB5_19240 [Promethearchaeota archaeon]